jgi:methyltransferase (TIGR00027 family)
MLEATARWTAAVRALETERGDALFRDPLAAVLAGEDGARWISGRTPESVLPIVLRTRYFDDWLSAALARGIDQVVLPGAGLDTRPYRLAVPPATRWYEVDRAAVLAAKQAVLEGARAVPGCEVIGVPADLAEAWPEALADAGYEPGRPAAWLLEGLLFYLPASLIASVLGAVSSLAAPGSRLGFDIVNNAVLTSPWTSGWVQMQAVAGAPWIGTMEDPVAVLAELGWTATLTQAGQPDANHGRWVLPVLPTHMPDVPHSWFVTALRPA